MGNWVNILIIGDSTPVTLILGWLYASLAYIQTNPCPFPLNTPSSFMGKELPVHNIISNLLWWLSRCLWQSMPVDGFHRAFPQLCSLSLNNSPTIVLQKHIRHEVGDDSFHGDDLDVPGSKPRWLFCTLRQGRGAPKQFRGNKMAQTCPKYKSTVNIEYRYTDG